MASQIQYPEYVAAVKRAEAAKSSSSSGGSSSSNTYFGAPPSSPFTKPGTYITPTGKVSSGGGSAVSGTKSSGGGGGGSYDVTSGTYTSPTGEKQSMAAEDAKKLTTQITTEPPQKKTLQSYEQISPYMSVVEPASALKSRYWGDVWSDIKSRPIAGTLGLIKEQVSGKTSEFLFQTEASPFFRRTAEASGIGAGLGTAARTAPYFIPYAGTSLMVAEGTESVILEPTLLGKGLGLAEAGLGAYGLRTEIKNLGIAREMKAIENTKIKVAGYRLESGKSGADLLVGTFDTKSAKYTTELVQPYFTTKKGFTLESGRALSFRVTDTNIKAAEFATGGRGLNLGTTPKLFKGKVGMEIKDATAGMGRFYLEQKAVANLKLTKGFAGESFKLEAAGIMKSAPKSKEYTNFIGLGKEEGEFLKVIGAKAQKISFGETITISGKPSTIGIIKRVTPADLTGGTFAFSNIPKTNFPANLPAGTITATATKTIPSYTEGMIKQIAKSTLPELKMVYPGAGALFGTTRKETQQIKTSQFSFPVSIPATKELQTPKIVNVQKLISGTQTRQTPRLINMQGIISIPKTEQIPRLANIPVSKIITKQETAPRFRTPFAASPITPKFPIAEFPIIPIIPTLPSLGWGEGLGRSFKVGRGYKYQPSIGAILKGYTSPKIGKAEKFAEFTGFMGRPSVSGRSRKKKKI